MKRLEVWMGTNVSQVPNSVPTEVAFSVDNALTQQPIQSSLEGGILRTVHCRTLRGHRCISHPKELLLTNGVERINEPPYKQTPRATSKRSRTSSGTRESRPTARNLAVQSFAVTRTASPRSGSTRRNIAETRSASSQLSIVIVLK